MQSKEEIESILNKCDDCKLDECINCEISYAERQKIKEYIEKKYLEGYIRKQNEAIEICEKCKYREKVREAEKKEIEKKFEYRDIERLRDLCANKSTQRFEFNDLIALENLIKDYESLESREQKLAEKLEEDKMEQLDDYIIYLLDTYLKILKGEN